jgi:hypothetical protein
MNLESEMKRKGAKMQRREKPFVFEPLNLCAFASLRLCVERNCHD